MSGKGRERRRSKIKNATDEVEFFVWSLKCLFGCCQRHKKCARKTTTKFALNEQTKSTNLNQSKWKATEWTKKREKRKEKKEEGTRHSSSSSKKTNAGWNKKLGKQWRVRKNRMDQVLSEYSYMACDYVCDSCYSHDRTNATMNRRKKIIIMVLCVCMCIGLWIPNIWYFFIVPYKFASFKQAQHIYALYLRLIYSTLS